MSDYSRKVIISAFVVNAIGWLLLAHTSYNLGRASAAMPSSPVELIEGIRHVQMAVNKLELESVVMNSKLLNIDSQMRNTFSDRKNCMSHRVQSAHDIAFIKGRLGIED